MEVDILLFGAHPDDVEWGAGGTCLLMQRQGLRFAFIDLTAGEMGSRGTPDERALEAQSAAGPVFFRPPAPLTAPEPSSAVLFLIASFFAGWALVRRRHKDEPKLRRR